MQDDQGPNMEARAFIAVVLSLLVMFVYQYFFAPVPPDPLPDPTVDPPIDAPVGAPAGASPAEQAGRPATPPEAVPTSPEDSNTTIPAGPQGLQEADAAEISTVAANEQEITLETDRFTMTLSNRGGRITGLLLHDYVGDFGDPLDLIATDDGLAPLLELWTPERPEIAATVNEALFVVDVDGAAARRSMSITGPTEIRFRWADGAGTSVEKRLMVSPGTYMSQLQVSVQDPTNTRFFVTAGPGLEARADTTRAGVYLVSGAILFDGNSVEQLSVGDLEEAQIRPANLAWGGIQSNYFLAAFVPQGPTNVFVDAAAEPAEAAPEGADAAATVQGGAGTRARLGIEIPVPGLNAPFYTGPKSFDVLAAEGYGLERAVDYGMFAILARPVAVVLKTLYGLTGNYGLAIIIATLGVRLLFFPLSQKSMKSMRKMQTLQPQMNAIRAKYKGMKDIDKRQEMNTEVMQLYKDNGVSPLGGCLPMLLQMPVLFGFYAAISVSIELRQAPFVLWIRDLSMMDPYYILPLLMGASMFVQQRMSPSTGDPVQQRIFRLMPVMFTFFFLRFPSGLVVYWLLNTVLGIAQQAYVNHQLEGPEPMTAKGPKKPRGGKGQKSGGAKRKKRGK